MTVLRVCYPSGTAFDETYYLATHLPLAASVLGPFGVTRVEMMKVTASADGSQPPYQVIFSAYFEAADAVDRALRSPHAADILADVPKFFRGAPEVLVGTLVPLPA